MPYSYIMGIVFKSFPAKYDKILLKLSCCIATKGTVNFSIEEGTTYFLKKKKKKTKYITRAESLFLFLQ